MTAAVCGALLAVVIFAVTAPRLGRHLPPALATRLLVPTTLVMAAATVIVLGLLASGPGFRIPVGGARSITDALIRRLEEAGGALRLNAHVERIVVRDGRAVAVRTTDGDEIAAKRAVLADVTAPSLFLRLLPAQAVSGAPANRSGEAGRT